MQSFRGAEFCYNRSYLIDVERSVSLQLLSSMQAGLHLIGRSSQCRQVSSSQAGIFQVGRSSGRQVASSAGFLQAGLVSARQAGLHQAGRQILSRQMSNSSISLSSKYGASNMQQNKDGSTRQGGTSSHSPRVESYGGRPQNKQGKSYYQRRRRI